MIKLWGNYGVGKGRNTTGFNGCLYYDAFFEVLTKSLKGEKSLVQNVQNIKTDNFNLVKSLKNIISKYYSLYFKDIAFFKQHLL